MNAPIVLNVYKRPRHTEITLEALSRNELANDSILYIFCDGPRKFASKEDLDAISEVRSLIRKKKWCKEVFIIESNENLGQVRSFETAITEVVNTYGKVIVLEDDQKTQIGFLRYLNSALEMYEDEEQVMYVSAYMYPSKFDVDQTTFFLNVQSCPGWATWKRAWNKYNGNAPDHIDFFQGSAKLIDHFNIKYSLWYDQLIKNVEIPGFSFAVKWYASCYRSNGLGLFPKQSLIENIGIDGSGEHCGVSDIYDVIPIESLSIKKESIKENTAIRKSIGLHYKKYHYGEIKNRKIKTYIGNIKELILRIIKKPFQIVFPVLRENNTVSITKSKVAPLAKIYSNCKIIESEIGAYTYISNNAIISYSSIGKFCSIGPNLLCGWGIHPLDGISTSPMFYSTACQNGKTLSFNNKVVERKIITIGNDVFIGMNVIILDGVAIGDGAIIGAGCVVSKDVPPYAVVVGVPMKIIKYRFDDELIKKLLELKWWDWPLEKLKWIEKDFFNLNEIFAADGEKKS